MAVEKELEAMGLKKTEPPGWWYRLRVWFGFPPRPSTRDSLASLLAYQDRLGKAIQELRQEQASLRITVQLGLGTTDGKTAYGVYDTLQAHRKKLDDHTEDVLRIRGALDSEYKARNTLQADILEIKAALQFCKVDGKPTLVPDLALRLEHLEEVKRAHGKTLTDHLDRSPWDDPAPQRMRGEPREADQRSRDEVGPLAPRNAADGGAAAGLPRAPRHAPQADHGAGGALVHDRDHVAEGDAQDEEAHHQEAEEVTMPAKSKAQLKFMQAAAHNPRFAKKAGIPQATAREFVQATPKGKKLPARKR